MTSNPLFPPRLPEREPDPDARALALSRAQDEYAWDWSWPPGCATVRALPRRDEYPLDYIARIAALVAELTRNHGRLALDGAKTLGLPKPPTTSDELSRSFFSAAQSFHVTAPRVRPREIDRYADYYASLPVPPRVARARRDPDAADLLFAWQRVGGANPMSLRRVARLPDDFAVTEAHWRAALGEGATLAAALDGGRVFVVDHSLLHGAPATRYLGRQKYLYGARGVFASPDGALRPVALQLAPGGRVYTPADGVAWAMARYCFNVADANVHETMEHLGATHLVMEAAGVAARRQLADEHPLRRLLEPHIEGTFAINHSAKTSLIAPGGVIEQVFAARIDVAASLVRVALDRFSLQDRAPAVELRARGVDDRDALPSHPYRDGVTAVYGCIARFVAAYLRLYYPDDASVLRDQELRAWVDEVASPIGGALRGVRPVETFDDLATWMSNLVHVASAQHAAINFPQYPFMSWGADIAGACWGPGPGDAPTEADLLALMPPWDCLTLQADTVFQLSGVHYNKLGAYGAFADPRVAPLVQSFQRELASLEDELSGDDALLPYPFLRPSQIPASIHI